MQALLDSGVLGAVLYLVIMGLTLWRTVWLDATKTHAAVLYSLLFLSIANIGETVVYTPATFHATYFWYVAILALGLRTSSVTSASPSVEPVVAAEPARTTRYPLLSCPVARKE